MTPCLENGCPTLTPKGRCRTHRRNHNLARDQLENIAIRDEWVCGICNTPIDPTLRGTRNPSAPTIHHIDGTSDTPPNLTIAHSICNIRHR